MKRITKQKKLICLAVLFLFLSRITALAAGGLAVVENYTGESETVLYLKGVKGDISDISVQAGTTVCDSVTQSRLSDSSQPVKTLVMLDNSLSIPKSDRKRVTKIIRNVIADRMDSEQMAVAVFGEGMQYLAEYTMDDAQLLHAAEDVTYKKSSTYLTDVLYEALSEEYIQKKEDVFFRMIVISDGMDNKSIGYTKEELFDLLKEYPVPIYTVGIQTSKKNNNKQLKNMFALSRMTGAQSFVLGDTENLLDINEAVNEDQSIVRLAVMPQRELMDGSRKTLKITLASGESISAEAVMPQQISVAEQTVPQTVLSAEHGETEEIQKQEDVGGSGKMWMILVPVCLFVVCATAIVIVLILKHKNEKPGTSSYGASPQSYGNQSQNYMETEMLRTRGTDGEEGTIGMWETGDRHSYQMTLTDIHDAAYFFQMPLRGSVVVGRKQGECGLVIDYDRSVSGRHCEIKEHNGKFYIKDLKSLNGTCVNGMSVSSETEITSGSTIKMGKLEFRFEIR